jgi:hypothetical protein
MWQPPGSLLPVLTAPIPIFTPSNCRSSGKGLFLCIQSMIVSRGQKAPRFHQKGTLMRIIPPWLALAFVLLMSNVSPAQPAQTWKMHDMSRPLPPIVQVHDLKLPVFPPTDATVLFDGTSLSHWRGQDGGPAKWVIQDGYFAATPGSGSVHTLEAFGDVQLHVEWATPVPVHGKGQGRGNSGVFLMGLYEIQILDSYQNETYADGQAAAVYGQYPPLSNASRPPGEWQSYDIFFRHPRFDPKGELLRPARVTVVHNGILVQDNVELTGPTSWLQNAPYKAHADRLPFSLQDHSNPVRFRNIWVRDLAEQPAQALLSPSIPGASALSPAMLDRYVGTYATKDGLRLVIMREGNGVFMNVGSDRVLLEPRSTREFLLARLDGSLEFAVDDRGIPQTCTFHITGDQIELSRQPQ